MSATRAHWEQVWAGRDPATVSWYQSEPTPSLALIASAGVGPRDPIVDVGGGVSPLVVRLARLGYLDLTVLDIAQTALDALNATLIAELGRHTTSLVCGDVLDWAPERPFMLWHDRAVNHFLVDSSDRQRYAALVSATVAPGGHLALAAFAPDGPERCSGLVVHRNDAAALAAEFAPAFDLVRITRELHHTPWQAKQSFHYLLLRRR